MTNLPEAKKKTRTAHLVRNSRHHTQTESNIQHHDNITDPHRDLSTPREKIDAFNTQFHTVNTITHTAYDRIHQSKATTERPGQAPRSVSLRQGMHRILDAAWRMGLP